LGRLNSYRKTETVKKEKLIGKLLCTDQFSKKVGTDPFDCFSGPMKANKGISR